MEERKETTICNFFFLSVFFYFYYLIKHVQKKKRGFSVNNVSILDPPLLEVPNVVCDYFDEPLP